MIPQPLIHLGCCGFPKGMKAYFSTFDAVEVQQTFYRPPQLKTALRWRAQAPHDFEFALKAWQLITHSPTSPTYRRSGLSLGKEDRSRYGFFRPTAEVWAAWETTKEIAHALQARGVVFQCPASFKPTEENGENLRRFFSSVDREGFTFVWEPRGEWQAEEVRALCAELGLVHGVDPFVGDPVYGNINYFRLHGGPGYRHQYSHEELVSLLDKCRDKESYVMFNNMWMYEDSLRFREILEDLS